MFGETEAQRQHFKVCTRGKWLRQELLETLLLVCFYLSKNSVNNKRERKSPYSIHWYARQHPMFNSISKAFPPSSDRFHKSWSKLRDWRVLVGTVSYFECAFWKLKLLEQNLSSSILYLFYKEKDSCKSSGIWLKKWTKLEAVWLTCQLCLEC